MGVYRIMLHKHWVLVKISVVIVSLGVVLAVSKYATDSTQICTIDS